ncbi:hypothetical protein TNCV_654431 [Trichonephila clavipes]|nr:hypothetical protein TNCV_654431 [Trichonephila clavipes]
MEHYTDTELADCNGRALQRLYAKRYLRMQTCTRDIPLANSPCCSFEQHAGGDTIWLGSTPTSVGGQRPPNSLPFHQHHDRICSLMAIQNTLMPQRHYTFTNKHAFSRISTQTLRRSSQRH